MDLKEWTSLTHRRAWKDTDEIYTTFIEMCRDAGPKKCAIHDDSLFVIAMRVDAVQQSLRTHPVIVYDETDSGTTTDIITYTAFSRLIGLVLDQPVYRFSLFADIVAALEKGDGQPAMQFFKQFGQYEADSGCPTIGELPDQIPSRGVDAFRAIGCTDGGGLNETVEEFKKYADDLMVISRSLGAFAALFRMSCVGWTQGAKLAFTGEHSYCCSRLRIDLDRTICSSDCASDSTHQQSTGPCYATRECSRERERFQRFCSLGTELTWCKSK